MSEQIEGSATGHRLSCRSKASVEKTSDNTKADAFLLHDATQSAVLQRRVAVRLSTCGVDGLWSYRFKYFEDDDIYSRL